MTSLCYLLYSFACLYKTIIPDHRILHFWQCAAQILEIFCMYLAGATVGLMNNAEDETGWGELILREVYVAEMLWVHWRR